MSASQPTQPAQDAPAVNSLEQLFQSIGGVQVPAAHNVGTVEITDDSVTASEFDAYKGRKDVTDRLTILLPKRIQFGRVHYVDEKGYYICLTGFKKQGGQEIPQAPVQACCNRLDMPQQRFSALVVHYDTTPKGQLVEPFGFKLKVWRFGARTFEQIRAANEQWPLDQHDLMVKCTDDKYQRVEMQSCKNSIAAADPFIKKYGKDLQDWVSAMLVKLPQTVGRRLDAAGWAELLGAAAPGVANVAAAAADAPIDDISQLINISQ